MVTAENLVLPKRVSMLPAEETPPPFDPLIIFLLEELDEMRVTSSRSYDYFLYFDGIVSLRTKRAGFGWILKDRDGKQVDEDAGPFENEFGEEVQLSPADMKVVSMVNGIQCCLLNSHFNILVRSDSKLVIEHMTGKKPVRSSKRFIYFANQGKELIAKMPGGVHFELITKAENTEANLMAKCVLDPRIAQQIGYTPETIVRPSQLESNPSIETNNNLSRTKLYYGREWLKYISMIKDSVKQLAEARQRLKTVPAAMQKIPPDFLPPFMNISDFFTLDDDAMAGNEEAEYDHSDSLEMPQQNVLGAAMEQNTNTSQVRYLLIYIEVHLMNAYGDVGKKALEQCKLPVFQYVNNLGKQVMLAVVLKLKAWMRIYSDAQKRRLPLSAILEDGHSHLALSDLLIKNSYMVDMYDKSHSIPKKLITDSYDINKLVEDLNSFEEDEKKVNVAKSTEVQKKKKRNKKKKKKTSKKADDRNAAPNSTTAAQTNDSDISEDEGSDEKNQQITLSSKPAKHSREEEHVPMKGPASISQSTAATLESEETTAAEKVPVSLLSNDIYSILLRNYECPICLDLLACPVSLSPCGDTFCYACISNYQVKSEKNHCPHCMASIIDLSKVVPDGETEQTVRELLEGQVTDETGEEKGKAKKLLHDWEARVKVGRDLQLDAEFGDSSAGGNKKVSQKGKKK